MKQQRQVQQQQMAMQQQQVRIQQQQIAEGRRRWEEGALARELELEAGKLTVETLKEDAAGKKMQKQIGELVAGYMEEEGLTSFTNIEQAFETIPGLAEYGSQIGYIGEVLQPFMQQAIGPAELLQWGASYESFAKAHPQYEGIVTPESWAEKSSRFARIEEIKLENAELGNELMGIETETARKEFANYDKILAARLRAPGGSPGAPKPSTERTAMANLADRIMGGIYQDEVGNFQFSYMPSPEEWAGAYGRELSEAEITAQMKNYLIQYESLLAGQQEDISMWGKIKKGLGG